MKTFIFVGDIVDVSNYKNYSESSSNTTNYAAFKYFNRLISSMENQDYHYEFLSVPYLGEYKKNTHLKNNNCFINTTNWNYGICSTKKYLRLIQCNHAFKKIEKKLLSRIKKSNDDFYIFITQPNIFYIKSALRLNKKLKGKVIQFIPDLTIYSNIAKHSFIISLLKRLESKIVSKHLKNLNGFILFSSEIKNKLKIEKPTITIETITDGVLYKNQIKKRDSVKKILYAGTINEKFGIKEFYEAFIKYTDDNYVLVIAGSGDLEEFFKNQNNKKLAYLGPLDSQEIIQLQRECDVMVNPRPNSGEYVKYSFPSKIIEYLTYNGVVACFKLSGIPDEYDEVLHYPKTNNFESLVKLCKDLANISEDEKNILFEKVNKLLARKDKNSSLNKIIEFLEELP